MHYAQILPLINFENRQCNLRATKAVMKEGGVIRSDAVRHPFAPLPAATREGLLELIRAVQPLAFGVGSTVYRAYCLRPAINAAMI